MAQTKSRPITDVKVMKRSKSRAELVKQYTGRDPARIPANFKKILAEEIKILRLPLSTPKYPFKSVRPPAVDSEYVQTGLSDYLFKDVDYAIIKFLFGITDPSKLNKSRLKAWLVNKCNVLHSELGKCSWPDIREFSLSGIEAEYATQQSRKAKHPKRKDKTTQQVLKEPAIKARFSFNEAQAFFNGKDLGLPSNKPVSILRRLVDSLGEVVKHKDLDQDSNPSNASDILKGRILTIKKALKRHKIPYKIVPKRGVGYVLQQAQTASH